MLIWGDSLIGKTLFYINYEECKLYILINTFSLFLSFILTMRNVNQPGALIVEGYVLVLY